MITRQQKEQVVKDLSDKLSRAKTVVFADYAGLAVNDLSQLRRQGREQQIEIKVAKKTLIDMALQKASLTDISAKDMQGQIGLVFGYADVISPAKLIYEFSKVNENLKILGGVIEGKAAPVEQILSLAKLPSLPDLQAQLLSVMNGPIRGLVALMQGVLRGLVGVLKAKADNEEQQIINHQASITKQ